MKVRKAGKIDAFNPNFASHGCFDCGSPIFIYFVITRPLFLKYTPEIMKLFIAILLF